MLNTTHVDAIIAPLESGAIVSGESLGMPRETVLGELLTHVHPNLRLYNEVIASVEFERQFSLPPTASYAIAWKPMLGSSIGRETWQTGVRAIEEGVRGHLLVDIGGGKPVNGSVSRMQEFAVRMGASSFINVERYAVDRSDGEYPADIHADVSTLQGIAQPERTRVALVQADMLSFLAALPDACCNITMNGIDSRVVHYSEYHEFLAAEVARVLPPGGIAFGIKAAPLRILETKSAAYGLENLSQLLAGNTETSFLRKF